MEPGYLYLESNAEYPGLVRFLVSDRLPSTEQNQGVFVRYVARFDDIDAAMMHVQNELRHSLVDIDEHLYRVPLTAAVAAVEADDLKHERVWMDETVEKEELRSCTDGFVAQHRRQDLFWRWVGLIAIGWLLLGFLGAL